MDIEKSEGAVYLSLTDEEAEKAGLCYDTFEKGHGPTEEFLRRILPVLRKKGLLDGQENSLDVEVIETEEGLMISISEHGRLRNERVSIFSDPTELALALGDICSGAGNKCELWKCGGCYAVISETEETDQRILAAKIREYGKLLSDSPFDCII